jgi:hypothetical protein
MVNIYRDIILRKIFGKIIRMFLHASSNVRSYAIGKQGNFHLYMNTNFDLAIDLIFY